ncbi:BLUF domain-containing protein [Stappia sp. 28M-7]|jgi:hypothetical protein|uniref:BLUF domain-containing protein n=1 Tax=Stappia sp. 28M-7 TaxID=2762596 RepID=UPI000FF1B798|nr:BLUF domain-containing protein [Stappia sp. 28M-7]MBC2859261.1 BLUF domain-containing protein [Stappia sp. 28M-7]
MTITRVSYRSRINFSDMTLSLDEEVDRLLAVARRNNTRDGLTSALLLAGNTFFQVLEGEHGAVERAFARIIDDTRHVGCQIIDRREDTARLLPGMPMFFADALDSQDAVLSNLYIPICQAPELASYDDLASAVIFSAARHARLNAQPRAISA